MEAAFETLKACIVHGYAIGATRARSITTRNPKPIELDASSRKGSTLRTAAATAS
jgi:hypothetical protein